MSHQGTGTRSGAMGQTNPMAGSRADIALLTDRRYTAAEAARDDWYLRNILADDRLLAAALWSRGLSSVRLDWADPRVDWGAFRAVVFRTTWDYYDRQPEFAAWLDRVEPTARLINAAGTVRWNLDKHYLADLASRGIPVVPTRFLERGAPVSLAATLEAEGWTEGVVKPAVSGGARHTHRFDRASAAALDGPIGALVSDEAFLVQPFEPDIIAHGEDTLVIIDGHFTHALSKRAKPGDFRVQDDHGGTVHPCSPSREQIALAERAIRASGSDAAYGRVDLVRRGSGGWAVMELELVEPELWLRRHPPAADALAAAIAARIA